MIGRITATLFRRKQTLTTVASRVLSTIANTQKRVHFVQVGSNDADFGDPLRAFILRGGWHGVMIEPVPYVFARLRQKYSAFPDITCLNIAIAETDSTREFFHLRESGDDLPKWYDQVGSFSKEHVLKHQQYIPDLPDRLITSLVQCKPLSSVLASFESNSLDVLHSDIEGHDDLVVSALLSSSYRPKVLIYEHMHLPAQVAEVTREKLIKAGYQLFLDAHHTVAVLATETALLDAANPLS
jgi:FkbM family methyltransferase